MNAVYTGLDPAALRAGDALASAAPSATTTWVAASAAVGGVARATSAAGQAVPAGGDHGVLPLRLPVLSRTTVALLNRLYRSGASQGFDGWGRQCQWRWRVDGRGPGEPVDSDAARAAVAPHADGVVGVQLAGERSRATLLIEHALPDHISEAPPWQQLQDDARLLAWTMRHEPLLPLLSAWAGESLRPAGMVESPTVASADELRLDFEVFSDGQRLLRAALHWPAAQALLFEPDASVGDAGRARDIDALPLPAALQLAPLVLTAAAAAGLAAGDVLVVGAAAMLAPEAVWTVQVADRQFGVVRHVDGWRVRGPATQSIAASSAGGAMTGTASTEGSSTAAATAALDALPLTLTFDIGELAFSVGRLRELAAGQVLELPQHIGQAPVRVCVNGREFARGELVTIGEALGVRLLRVGGDGLR